MPYRKKSQKTKKRRSNRLTLYVSPKQIVPDTIIVSMRYNDTVLIDPAAAGISNSHVFRANSIFDPDYTGAGHQPLGRDQWYEFYRHYCVEKSSIVARFIAQGATAAASSCIAGVGLLRSPTISTNVNTVIERRDANTRVMTTVNAQGTVTVRNRYDAKKFHGYKDLGDSAETRTAMDANPDDQAYFHVFLSGTSGDVESTAVSILITYQVRLMERIDLLES